MKEIDVVMLAYTLDEEVFAMTTAAIHSLRASEPEIHFRVLVLESNVKWPEMGWNYDAETQVHIPDIPFNFNQFNNIGREMTQADWVVFSNNDVVFQPGWCSALLKANAENPALRSLCPVDPKAKYTLPGTFSPQVTYQIGYLVRVTFTGWCFMVQRSVFAETGPFDPRFDYYFADDDFAMSLRKHNILNAAIPAAQVNHLGHITSKKAELNISEKFLQAQKTYHAKWGSQRLIAWKTRLVDYFLRPLGMKGIIRKIYRAQP
ncbi:MAG TPA: hypothetical protein ENJ82_11205 [Bacteroidetes bacterium]|nr:hypothetical protein [Bacteroidota bacterium]